MNFVLIAYTLEKLEEVLGCKVLGRGRSALAPEPLPAPPRADK